MYNSYSETVYAEVIINCKVLSIRNERREAIDRDEGVGSSTSSPVNEKVDELPTASNAVLDRQIKDALHRQDIRGNGRRLVSLSTCIVEPLPSTRQIIANFRLTPLI